MVQGKIGGVNDTAVGEGDADADADADTDIDNDGDGYTAVTAPLVTDSPSSVPSFGVTTTSMVSPVPKYRSDREWKLGPTRNPPRPSPRGCA